MSESWLIFPISYYKQNCFKQNEFTQILRRKKLKAPWNSKSERKNNKNGANDEINSRTLHHDWARYQDCVSLEKVQGM